MTVNGVAEKISIENLQVREPRQLYSETGTLVIAMRTADELVLDIGGDKTTVPMLEPVGASEQEITALIATYKSGDGGKKLVIRVQRSAGERASHAGAERRVIVLDGDAAGFVERQGDAAGIAVDKAGDARHGIVKRTVKPDPSE